MPRCPCPALPSCRVEERLQSLSDTKTYNILHLRAEDDWIEHCVHWEGIEDGEWAPARQYGAGIKAPVASIVCTDGGGIEDREWLPASKASRQAARI